MNKTIIVECSQQASIDNYLISYKDLDDENIENNITNSKWTTKITPINLEVGDTIEIQNASLSTKGLNDESVEIIGTATNNLNLTDNKIQIENAYYVNNNWTNNFMLPPSIAYLKNFKDNYEKGNFRNTDFNNIYNKYNIPVNVTSYIDIYKAFWSDYGAPSLETYDNWLNNSAFEKNTQNAQKLQNLNSNEYSNTLCSGNLMNYRPNQDRLYIGQDDFIGFYNNGYNSFHNLNIGQEGVDYSQIFKLQTSTIDIEVKEGFSSPIVLGNEITEQLLQSDNDNKNNFIEPKIIDYNIDTKKGFTTASSYKNYFNEEKLTQITSGVNKIIPTTFGKILYDLQNGKANFSLNLIYKLITGINVLTSPDTAKYYMNNLLVGDYKRAIAITELYSNLSKCKNINTIDVTNLENCSFYSGSINPNTNWETQPIKPTDSSGYPSSLPFDLGEQMVLFDDLEIFSRGLTSDEILESKNYFLIRSLNHTTFENDTNNLPIRPSVDFKVLDLKNNMVIMSNMVANKENFEKLKRVQSQLEKPTKDNIKINYNSTTFKDTLCISLELGRLDDRDTQSIFNINNYYDASLTPKTLPNIENGISMPCCLPSVKNIADKKSLTDIPSYNNYLMFPRLPLFAGLFCDEDNIKIKTEPPKPSSSEKPKVYTYLDEFRSNNMYEFDFYSRYNKTRVPDSETLILPSGNNNDFNFKDTNGNYYDDTEIKNNDLGVVVAYKTISGKNIPFIGFVCMEQIPKNYNIPLPVVGEFFGISPSLQNNSFSFSCSWENKVTFDNGGQGVGDILITNGGHSYTTTPSVVFTGGGGSGATAEATISGGSINNIVITNSGQDYITAPTISFSPAVLTLLTEKPIVGGGSSNSDVTITGNAVNIGFASDGYLRSSGPEEFYTNYNGSLTAPLPVGFLPMKLNYQFTSDKVITKYRIWPRTGNTQLPKSWFVYGAVSESELNSGNFTELHSVSFSNVSEWNAPSNWSVSGQQPAENFLNLSNVFTISNTQSFKFFQLKITQSFASPAFCGISEVALYSNLELQAGEGAKATAVLRSLRNSYKKENPVLPYINVGANDIQCSFNSNSSRMFLSKLHTMLKEGQSSNNMLRYYEGIQFYNDRDEEIISPDSEASNDVVKINRRRFEVNSLRAGYTEGLPEKIVENQIFPLSNDAIKSKGLCSSITGIGITNIKIGKKDGDYISINQFNDYNFKGTLLDKLGMNNIQQLLPPFGKQNNFFSRSKQNKDIFENNKALSIYNNCVFPLTTNCFITPSFNQSVNTNNLNFIMGSIDGDNNLEKSIPQISDEIIFNNLPQKFSYSHLLIYSNIIPKYNYIGGNQINKLPCVASVNRSYQQGDFIYLNQQNPIYEVDLNYSISDILIDIRMPNGLPAPLSSGSNVNLQINKKKAIPLILK